MKNYSNASKIGIIVSVIGTLTFGINYLFGPFNNMKVGASFSFLASMVTLFWFNIMIAESEKKKKIQKERQEL
ncbi:hypothetical protein LGL55_06930 [Clostridium tagluense]|uniref:hypothetical protein n=2 Tax=Clostridium tagluense TaxID=360422 RepID=UPI001CF3A827|nr:hypothetical protein [Clostridium tagluense]MCB2310939.1 hypothetical protein [Clostridium tagluense]MCB2315793.1 hypothetical protein [Clostridium tagluense]MCB2320563.1 hypothetical protein [Clostridium tagluense]MCB2325532.1 hypothetical protein [Clostridium tagluense]MCB2330385.1 hypothetical protein [Clostridium tagluense]